MRKKFVEKRRLEKLPRLLAKVCSPVSFKQHTLTVLLQLIYKILTREMAKPSAAPLMSLKLSEW